MAFGMSFQVLHLAHFLHQEVGQFGQIWVTWVTPSADSTRGAIVLKSLASDTPLNVVLDHVEHRDSSFSPLCGVRAKSRHARQKLRLKDQGSD